MSNVQIDMTYPLDSEYEYEAQLDTVNLDDKREKSLRSGKGFIISRPQKSLKKDVKDPNSIFSTKFGQTLEDVNPFIDRYKCDCGYTRGRINNNTKCPSCGTYVKYVDDDFGISGWMVLKDPYYIIHPNLYKKLEHFIGGKKLDNIIKIVDKKNIDGHSMPRAVNNKEPFAGIGILEFKERFDEIIQFYYKKSTSKHKNGYYNEIMKNKDKVFIQSIHVFTTYLRPFEMDRSDFRFEGTNAIYNMMAKLVYCINNDTLKILRKKKNKNELLYDLNLKYQKLYKELEKILSGKKGTLRSVFGGRYTFTSRSVIIPNPRLRIDQVTMPYAAMVELMQQTIVNILQKTYNITYSEAYNIWSKAQRVKDQRVWNIIEGLIKDSPNGIPIIINRNPTINHCFGNIAINVACIGDSARKPF